MRRLPTSRLLRLGMNLWPPFRGAGICVRSIGPDYRSFTVEMRLRFFNRNAVGTHFGGSLYAMIDPLYMLMVLANLGKEYLVWDKAGSIEYLAPGRGRVWARCDLTDEDLAQIVRMTADGDKHLHVFHTDIRDDNNMVIAHVEKVVYVRRRRSDGGAQ